MMKKTEWVSLVDDEVAVRDTLKMELGRSGCFRVRSVFETPHEAIGRLPRSVPDILLLDVRMPGMDGLECLHQIRDRLPATRIILFTAFGSADVLQHAIAGRANGLVQKGNSLKPLFETMHHATIGGFYLPHFGQIPTLEPSGIKPVKLSTRETQFLNMLALGLGNKQIADELKLGRQYVNNRLPKLYRQLGCHTAAGAVARAMKLGLIPPPRRERIS